MKNLSIIIPSYNNLRHLKNCYNSLRRWYPELELIIMDDASTDGTWEWLSEKVEDDENLLPMRFDERLGHTILYDEGIDSANNDIVGIIHADMLVTKNTFENMLKHLEKGKVVCSTRIEPPLHPAGEEKIIKDFGQDFDTLNVPAFEQFAMRMEKEYKNETTNGMFAPWILYKEDYEKAGGHDHIFAPFPYEDSDIFQRWLLEGYELIQARDSFVYHLTCRGHKWNEEVGKLDDGFEQFEERARKNWIRKWGSWIQNDNYQHPIIYPKYDIGFVVHNCKLEVYNLVEPWCSDIYVNNRFITEHIDMQYDGRKEQKLLINKTHHIGSDVDNDIVIEFDGDKLTNELYNQFIRHIQRIIHESEGTGAFKWNIFDVSIKNKKPFGKEHFSPIYKQEL